MNDATDFLLGLLEREGRSLHALLTRLTLRPDVAEDLMQELFLKLARMPGIARVRNPSAYARRAAIHLAFDWRWSRRHEVYAEAAGDGLGDGTDLPLAALIQREQWQAVLESTKDLSELSREVFVLHYLQEESFRVIAARLEKSPHQVRALCHKAVEQIRERLTPNLPESGPGRQRGTYATDRR